MVGNLKRPQIDYYLTIDMAKELCMVENNENGNKKGEIKERGYKIENVCYKVDYFSK